MSPTVYASKGMSPPNASNILTSAQPYRSQESLGKGPLPSHPDQALYEQTLLMLVRALLDVDIRTLDGIVQGDALRILKRKDAMILWELCLAAWQKNPAAERQMISAVMAVLRGFYPWLVLPDWAKDLDPEDL